jgi:large subunit ribosomal protein L31e
MTKTSEQTKETTKKQEVEQEEAEAPEIPEESKEPEKAAEELEEEEILEEPEEEIETEEAEEAKKEETEEGIVEERIYTIPLGRAWISPRQKRAPRAVRMIQSFIQRHMKPAALVISNEVNERIWSRGIRKPPRRIRVRAAKGTDGTVTLYLAEGD